MSTKSYRVACYPQPRLYPVKLNVVSNLMPVTSTAGRPMLEVNSVHPPMYVYNADTNSWLQVPQPLSTPKRY